MTRSEDGRDGMKKKYEIGERSNDTGYLHWEKTLAETKVAFNRRLWAAMCNKWHLALQIILA